MIGPVEGRLALARAQRIAQRNPFRLTRRQYDPGLVAEREQAVSTAIESEPSPIRQLVLAGVAGGPPWVAVIDHVPGLPGSGVLHVGDTLAGFIVLRIAPDTLVLRHGDTTVVLTPRPTWP
jgi:hypothetical protein